MHNIKHNMHSAHIGNKCNYAILKTLSHCSMFVLNVWKGDQSREWRIANFGVTQFHDNMKFDKGD